MFNKTYFDSIHDSFAVPYSFLVKFLLCICLDFSQYSHSFLFTYVFILVVLYVRYYQLYYVTSLYSYS